MMPVMDGTATARALRSIAPRLPVLMISGFFNGPAPAKDPRDAQLGKPFTAEELLRSVERLAAGSAN
jgi:CheY-like chemotaxis protein